MGPNIGVGKQWFRAIGKVGFQKILGEVMSMKVRALLSFVVVLVAMWLSSCGHYVCHTTLGNATCTPSGSGKSSGGGGNNISQTAFVYFMDDSVPQMAAEGLNFANSQTFAPISSFVSPLFPKTLGVDGGMVIVDKKYLYMPFDSGDLYAFSIDATTSDLTQNGNTYLAPSGTFTTIVADPNGAVLFVGGSAGITVYTINSTTGALTAAGTTPTGGIVPTQLETDGTGKYLYALTSNLITAFSYTSSGVLTPVTGSPFNFAPSMAQIEGEATGRFLLGITAETGGGSGATDSHIYVFSIASGGGLTIFGSPKATTYFPGYLAVSPNGMFVYTFNQTFGVTGSVNDPMEGFAFSTGTLTELGSSPFTGLDAQLGKFDQSGQYIFAVANVPNSGLSGEFAYGVSTTNGALTSSLAHAGVPSYSFAVTDEP
ncbi:MAG TPA: beta-propeller fold lactonase family protein [Candidatus Sulfotelmatobacter sp.]